jgi:twinkle protein
MIVPHEEISDRVKALWHAGGLPKGDPTGWPSLDKLYTVGLAQWTCVTGTPNSGKSEFIDALMVNLARKGNWKFWIYSPENHPLELHHAKILEKLIGKPFNPGPNERISEEELDKAEHWMKGRFMFCKPDRPDILTILDEEGGAMRHSATIKTGVVIDPWNQLEHHRPSNLTETEYISQTLSHVIERVREYNIHLWLIAHPAKMQRDKNGHYPIPTPRDIAGSAHFWNKADNCLTVHRDQVEGSSDVEIHCQKIRFKHIGKIGFTTLVYDRVTGRYREQLSVARAQYENQEG